jgi:cyclopropane-fatty-acyl-phospholipid synthase
MLALYGERAELADGQDILELGCGWGSLTLWMAERYPNARITACRTPRAARAHRGALPRARPWQRATSSPATSTGWKLDGRFDRCVSVEMFEHMRNYAGLLGASRLAAKPGGACSCTSSATAR